MSENTTDNSEIKRDEALKEVKYKKKLPEDAVPHKYGVLLVNMGGPQSLEEIPGYLYRLFSDPLIISLPRFLRHPLAKFIASRRTKAASERYTLIGGKSPLYDETAAQARNLEEVSGLPVVFCMRYTEPSVQTAHRELEQRGINRLVVLPLYPQYSTATTRSALEDFLNNRGSDLPYRFIEQHYSYPQFIKSLSELLLQTLQLADVSLKTHILFVAHSIPMKQVRAGDPYVDQVRETVDLIANSQNQGLPFPHSLAFQSRLGPVKWQGPTLEQALSRLKKDHVEQLIVHPVSFVSENLETLYDLDILFKEQSMKAGIKNYFRVPAPGVYPAYIEALALLIKEETGNKEIEHASI